MKRRVVKNLFATLVAVLFSVSAFSQNYYLVIGAFSTEKNNVKEITGFLPGNSIDTAYTVTTDNSTLQFYVMKSTKEDVVVSKSLQLRNELTNPVAVASSKPAETSEASGSSGVLGSASAAALKPRGKFFRFTVTNANGERIANLVHQVDPITGREIENYKVDEYIDLTRPVSASPMQVVSAPFGYKPAEKIIDYSSPWLTEGAYVDDRGAWVIPYVLDRLETGDVVPLYNVSFYKNAGVLLPTSKSDLDKLVQLLRENSKYVITIHAHCNDKHARKAAVPGSGNLFELSQAKEREVSAKELTRLRAEVVKTYLTTNGIDASRVRTFGWGAADMLVRPSDPDSAINDRIEIEIMKH